MSLSIEEILGFVPLTKAIETVKAGVPRLLPEAFYRRNPAFRLLGDKTRRIETAGTRKNARLIPYGAPSRIINQLPLSGRDIQLLHTEEKLEFSIELYMQIREFESYTVMQKLAEETRRQMSGALQRQMNVEASAVHCMLANGKLYFDTDSFLLPNSSGADTNATIDFLLPANNTGQLNGIIDASWSLATTNIPAQLKKIRAQARFSTGYPLKYALYGVNIMSQMLRNNFMQSYLVSLGGASLAKQFLDAGELPPKFMDFEWIPMNEAFFDKEDGTIAQIWGDDTIMFCPDPADPNVYGIYEGSYPVLNKFNMTSDVGGQAANWNHEYGRYGYGYPSFPPNNPLGLFGVYGDTFLPSIMNGAAWFLADTTP